MCVGECPAQVGTHSPADVEDFRRIGKMSNNVNLSPWGVIDVRKKKKKRKKSFPKCHFRKLQLESSAEIVLRQT